MKLNRLPLLLHNSTVIYARGRFTTWRGLQFYKILRVLERSHKTLLLHSLAYQFHLSNEVVFDNLVYWKAKYFTSCLNVTNINNRIR